MEFFQAKHIYIHCKSTNVLRGDGNRRVKFRPVIFGLLPDANEVWRHISQIWKNITGQKNIGHFCKG